MPRLHQLGAAAGRWWRRGGLVLLAAGLLLAYRAFPTRPDEGWDRLHGFELDSAECGELRRGRLTTTLIPPLDLDGPVTAVEAARKYGLEPALVCRANDLAAGECGRPWSPADGLLLLPLDRDPTRPAADAAEDAP